MGVQPLMGELNNYDDEQYSCPKRALAPLSAETDVASDDRWPT